MKEMSHETSVTLKQLLNFGGKFKPKLLWELLHSLSFYLKSALKDPSSWEQGPVFLICSSKINFLQDGNVSIKQGSIGEYSDNLHVAPEFYSSETKLASPTTTEQIYVYCLGMTLYSAAEFNCEEEVELPPELEEVLIGMVNEVATLRTSLTLISQACQANIPMSKKSALKELIRSYFKNNAMEKGRRPLRSSKSLPTPPPSPLTPPSLPPPPPPSFHTLPSTTSSKTVSSNSTSVSQDDKVDTALSKSHRTLGESNASQDYEEEKQEEDEGNPYSTYEDLDVEIDSTSSQAKPNGSSTRCKAVTSEKSDPNYSNAEELELENIRPTTGSSANSRCVSPQNLDNDCNTEDINLEVRKSNPTLEISGNRPSLIREASVSSSEPDNPYGTSKARCRTGCVVGQCTHSPTDLDRMYTTVQKIRTPGKHELMKRSSSSGRVDGFRLDTSISATSSESSQPVQLTMRTTGKPVIIQFPSNKRFQISGQRDDTIKSVFTTVIKRLSIEDSSLFGLLHSPGKGFLEFVSPEHKLKMYAPDKWKSDAPTSPPVALKLGVKFYPPSPHKFVNQVTRLQFFLHIRNLILEERYQITKDTAFDLAALALQADMGDYYDRTGNQYFDPYSYVPPDVMSTLSYIYVSKEIPMLHSKLDDMSQNEAVLRYLQIVAKLPDYGVHFFQVNERNPYEVEHSTIGVALQAVILYEKPKDSTLKRGTAHRYTWNQIANLSYKNKTFILDVTVSSNGKKSKNERRYNFETESTKISRAIMTLCADTHKFYIKLKNMLPPEKGEEPTFSVRDYTPSPRSVITNNNGPEDADAGDAKSPKKVATNHSDDNATKTSPFSLIDNEFEFLYDKTDRADRQTDLPYSTLNRFVASRGPVFEVFGDADEIERPYRDSEDEIDIPEKPQRVRVQSDGLDVPSIASSVRSWSLENLVASQNRGLVTQPLMEDDVIFVDAPNTHLNSNSADLRYPTSTANSRNSPDYDLNGNRFTETDKFALSFKTKGNFRSYKAKKTQEKKAKKKGVPFFNLRRTKSTTDVPDAKDLVQTLENFKAEHENSRGKNRLKRSQSGVVEMPAAYFQLDEDLRPGVVMKERAKERKKRKRLKLLSRAQRLKKKGSSTKISVDDYMTASEYESEDEICWIESPGYQVQSTPSELDLENQSQLQAPANSQDPSANISTSDHVTRETPKLARRVSFHADTVIIPSPWTMTTTPDSGSPSSSPDLPSPPPFLVSPLVSDRNSFHSSQESLTTRPMTPDIAPPSPVAMETTTTRDLEFGEDIITLNMEVDPGVTHLDHVTQEPRAADIGVQTSVRTLSFGCGDCSVDSRSCEADL